MDTNPNTAEVQKKATAEDLFGLPVAPDETLLVEPVVEKEPRPEPRKA